MEYDNYKPRRAKKPMTEQQALLKLTTLCTQSEHCSQEMLDKMKKWELPEDAIARNMEFLIQKFHHRSHQVFKSLVGYVEGEERWDRLFYHMS